MPVFSYTGLDSKGKEVKGIVDAEQIRAAKAKIKEQGIYLVDIVETQQRERKKGNLSFSLEAFKGGIKDADIVITTRLLSNLLKAHIPIVEALTAIIDQVEKPAFKMVLSQIRDRVNEGSSLSEALSQHPKLFSNIYANMVAAGEQSGALDIVMERLADFMEGQFRLKKKVQGAMVYPIIMFVFAIGVVGVLFTFVIPKIVKLFDDIKATLPLPTKILIWISSVVSNYWWLLLILLIIAVVLFRRWKRSEEGAYKWDRWMLNAPIFGDIVLMLAISRFSKTLSTLLSSGVPLLTSMDIVKNILNNRVLLKVLEAARENVREGESLAQPLKRSAEFPPIVTHMIAIGERTGGLEEMLTHVADSYDAQIDAKVSALTSIIEPLMIIFMGAIVGFIVLSIMLPILTLNQQIRM